MGEIVNGTTTNGRVSTYTPNTLNQYENRSIPRAFDVIGKADAAATVTIDGNPATRLDEFFYKELPAGSGAIHVPYTVQATDANGTTTRNGGKFIQATPENFVHDDDGNLTSDGRFTYTWDAENRLVAMQTHANIPQPARRKLAFTYDSMGRRIRKSVWHGVSTGGWQLHHRFDFIHELNGWNILAERSGGSANSYIRTYTWGADVAGASGSGSSLQGAGGVGGLLFTTLHTSNKTLANGYDLNGNVTLLVDTATGQTAATYDYGPFGEPIRQSGEYATLNPYRFSTKYTDDETGLLDYGLRYYNPATGRWLSRDPIEEAGGLNLYGFVGNDGLNKWDLLGKKIPRATGAYKNIPGHFAGMIDGKPASGKTIATFNLKVTEGVTALGFGNVTTPNKELLLSVALRNESSRAHEEQHVAKWGAWWNALADLAEPKLGWGCCAKERATFINKAVSYYTYMGKVDNLEFDRSLYASLDNDKEYIQASNKKSETREEFMDAKMKLKKCYE